MDYAQMPSVISLAVQPPSQADFGMKYILSYHFLFTTL